LQIKTKIVSCHTAYSKTVKQEVNSTVILPPLVFPAFGFTAPVLGWGRFETFEFGCTVAFHDPGMGVRSYVITMFIFVLGIPLGKLKS
jgi:hypothetical protein